MGWLTSKLLGMSPMEATAERRGFPLAPPAAQKRLETAGATFLQGYNLALRVDDLDLLGYRLEEVEPELRGFAYEGAAMALTILDSLTPWSQTRFRRFLDGPGAAHLYMLFVGAGWGLARLRRPATAMPSSSSSPISAMPIPRSPFDFRTGAGTSSSSNTRSTRRTECCRTQSRHRLPSSTSGTPINNRTNVR